MCLKEENEGMEIIVKDLIIESKSFIILRNIKSNFARSIQMTSIHVNMDNSALLHIILRRLRLI